MVQARKAFGNIPVSELSAYCWNFVCNLIRLAPTWLNPILDPEGPTWPENGSCRVQIGFIKYIIGLNSNLNPFWGQPDPIGPVFRSWWPTWPVWTRKLGPKLDWTQKNRDGSWDLTSSRENNEMKFVFIRVLVEWKLLSFLVNQITIYQGM